MGVGVIGGMRRRLNLLAIAVSMALAAVIILPIATSSAAETVVDDAGVLLLHVDSDGDSWVRYYADPASSLDVEAYDAHQTITVSNKCGVTTNGSLLDITSSGGTQGEGVVSNGLGVRDKNNCSTAQGRAGSGQSLTLTLGNGSALPDDVAIASVEVDVEGKFGADLGYAVDGGITALVDLPNTSDNGPDSGVGDNNLVTIDPSAPFSAITFLAAGGEISIEGGGDGTLAGGALRTDLGVNETVFELVTVTVYDGIIDCGEDTFQVGDGTTTAEAQFTRGSNNLVKGDETCTLIGYNLSSTTSGGQQIVEFEFEEDEFPSWFGEFVWAPETAVIPVPATQIDADNNGTFEANLEWCDGLSGVIDPETGQEIPVLPTGANWCLIDQQSTLLTDGTMQVTQSVYGITDPRWAR